MQCSKPLSTPLKTLSLLFFPRTPMANQRNPRCKIERDWRNSDWKGKPRERSCVNACICVAPERVLAACAIYLFNRINNRKALLSVFINYRHYRLVPLHHIYPLCPAQEPMIVQQFLSPCATNCLFRASNDEVSNTSPTFASAYKRNCEHRYSLRRSYCSERFVQGCVIPQCDFTQPRTNSDVFLPAHLMFMAHIHPFISFAVPFSNSKVAIYVLRFWVRSFTVRSLFLPLNERAMGTY